VWQRASWSDYDGRVRLRTAVLLLVVAIVGFAPPAHAQVAGPPPLAFHSAMLEQPAHVIAVRMQAMADVFVRITVLRGGVRLGRVDGAVHPGQTMLSVPIGPRTARRLHFGVRVDVRIDYGGPAPLRVRATKLLRPPRTDDGDAGPLSA